MTTARVRPGSVSGTVRAPPSKSYTHRALVAAHLTRRPYRIHDPLTSDDTLRTARGIRALGSEIDLAADRWTVSPGGTASSAEAAEIDCGESGTTLRLLASIAALGAGPTRFAGQGRLPRRPMEPLLRALRTLGAEVRPHSRAETLPLLLRGPIRGGRVELDASQSSQFTSSLLLALPTARPDSLVRLRGTIVSMPYVRATLAVLRFHRVRCSARRRDFAVPGGQAYRGSSFRVPGDASSAAYLWASAAMAGGTVTVRGVSPRWPQADLAVLDLLDRYGAEIRRSRDGTTVAAGEHRPFRITLTDSPDLYPLAGALAATAPGRSRLLGAPQVEGKESDRRRATVALARSLGARVDDSGPAVVIDGTARPRPVALGAEADHRVVMSAAAASLAATGPSSIAEARAVEKSYPGFWIALDAISGGVRLR
jgi:3-phosphoshikimate 1-carboxyvinyltransferase